MLKEQKGITLIALVITIIVLLILAGITIAMIGGQDSAPNKAAEAKIINDVGAAKDTIVMTAATAVEQWYEDKYVKTDATPADNAGAQVATALAATEDSNFTGDVQWKTKPSSTSNEFTIQSKSTGLGDNSSKHYEISGTIETNGTITWGDSDWK